MNNNFVLTIIALGVIGIFGIMALNYHERQQSPVEKISNSIDEAAEEISDEIDDHTTAK